MKQPFIFSIGILVLLAVGVWTNDRTIDLNIYDTYVVVSNIHIAISISFIILFMGMLYWVMHRLGLKPSKWIIRIHLGITYAGGLLALILSQVYGDGERSYGFYNNLNLSILLVGCIQLLLFVNFLIGLINMRKRSGG